MSYRNNTFYRASRLLREAFDFDDPMNDFDQSETEEVTETPEEAKEQTYDVDVANPVCPCCGVRLNIVDTEEEDSADSETDGIEAMDASLEPTSLNDENPDTYISIDGLGAEEEEEEEEAPAEPAKEEEDDDESYGEPVEAF